MTITNKIAMVLLAVVPVTFLMYLSIQPPVDSSHIRYGTGTFPLMGIALAFLVYAALPFYGDNSVDDQLIMAIKGIAALAGIAFSAIFVWVLIAGYPIVPA